MNALRSFHNDVWTQNPRVQMLVAKHFTLGFMDDFRQIVKTAAPLLLCNLSQVFFPMVSLFFCGHLGQNEFDGVSIGFTLINVLGLSFITGLLSACDTLFPQIYGGPNKKLLGLYLQKALIIQVLTCIPIIGLLFNSRNIMLLMVKEKQIAIIAFDYIRYYMPSVLFLSVANVLIKYVQCQNIVNPLMVINLIILVFNALLHYLFVFGLKMGVIGAAIAVDISCFTLMVVLFGFTIYRKLWTHTWSGWSVSCLFDWKVYLRLAIPGFLTLLIEWTYFEVGTFASSSIDDVELGAMSICQQVIYICFQFPYSIATAGNIHIGQLLGSNAPLKAKNASKVLYVVSIGTSLILCLFVAATSSALPYAFTNDSEIVSRTKSLLLFCAVVHLFDGGQGMFAGIMRTVGAQLYSSIAIFICFYVLGTPIGVVLTLKTPLLIYGFLIGVIIGCTALMATLIFYIIRIDWVKTAQSAYDLSKTNEDQIARKVSFNGVGDNVSKIEMTMVNPLYDEASMKKSTSESNPFDEKDTANLVEPFSEHFKSSNFVRVLIKRLVVLGVLIAICIGLSAMQGLNKYDSVAHETVSNITNVVTHSGDTRGDFISKNFYRLVFD